MNRVNETTTVIGNLGEDSSVKLVGDKKVLSFSLAIDKSYFNKEGVKVSKTKWLQVESWYNADNEVKLSNSLKKGKQVALTGEIKSKAYINTTSKEIVQQLGFDMDSCMLLGSKQE